jgi:hypothetical protein
VKTIFGCRAGRRPLPRAADPSAARDRASPDARLRRRRVLRGRGRSPYGVTGRRRLPRIAPSLGGVESLIEQPALMSFYELTTEERLQVGIKHKLIRYSVGIEDTVDLIADLAAALDRI